MEDKQNDTGGKLSHWAEEPCNYGPGMLTLPPAPAIPPTLADAQVFMVHAALSGQD